MELRAKLRSDPTDAAATRALANLLERSGRTRAALAMRKMILSRLTDSKELAAAQMDLGLALIEAGESEEAISLFEAMARRDPEAQQVQFELGTALARKEEFAAAFAAFEKATQLRPTNAEAQLSAAKALVTLLRYTEAEPYVDAAAQHGPQTAELYLLRGLIYGHTGREPQAVLALREAVHLDLKNSEAQSYLGEALRRNGQLVMPSSRSLPRHRFTLAFKRFSISEDLSRAQPPRR